MESTKDNFVAMLRNNKVPWYVGFSDSQNAFLKEYKTSSVIIKRKIKTGAVMSTQRFKATRTMQNNVFKRLCTLKTIYPYTVAISSEPTDYLALNTASTIVFSLFKRFKCDFKYINSGWAIKDSELITYKVVVIHNVVGIDDPKRTYKIRDLILKYPKALKLVVIGGTTGINYFDSYLRMPCSAMLHVLSGPNQNEFIKYKTKPSIETPVFTNEIERLLKPIVKKIEVKRE